MIYQMFSTTVFLLLASKKIRTLGFVISSLPVPTVAAGLYCILATVQQNNKVFVFHQFKSSN
jgi:hypothetical protein